MNRPYVYLYSTCTAMVYAYLCYLFCLHIVYIAEKPKTENWRGPAGIHLGDLRRPQGRRLNLETGVIIEKVSMKNHPAPQPLSRGPLLPLSRGPLLPHPLSKGF
jgi:hypothetical protein